MPAPSSAGERKMKGGARKGAGRKRLPPELKKRIITVRLKQATIEWLKQQDASYSATIEHCLTKQKEENE